MAGEPLKHKVLIVDDETINIQMIGNVLREYMSVIFATSGEDALTIARANNPDMILLDIVMPGMDGYEVCTALKSDPATEHIPITFVTAENTPEDEARGLSLGAIDFITKPFNPETLKVKVLNQLKQLESSARSRPAVAAPPAPQPAAPQPAAAAGKKNSGGKYCHLWRHRGGPIDRRRRRFGVDTGTGKGNPGGHPGARRATAARARRPAGHRRQSRNCAGRQAPGRQFPGCQFC